MYEEKSATGPSLKASRELNKSDNLDSIEITGAPGGSPDSPRWSVTHYFSGDDQRPQEFEFDDGAELLRHVAEHCNVPSEEKGNS